MSGTTPRFYAGVVWTVDVALVSEWLASLDERSRIQVVAALEVLAERGPGLGRPLVDTVNGSRHKRMKEHL